MAATASPGRSSGPATARRPRGSCCPPAPAARKTPAGAQTYRLLGSVYLDLVALRARSVMTVRRLAAGDAVGPEASADKLLLGAAEQSLLEAARSLLGARFAVGEDAGAARWRDEWW